MAGRAVRVHFNDQGIVITVAGNRDYVLEIAAGLALEPELLS